MNTIVIEHVALNELPAAWRDRLLIAPNTRVTVRIEEESEPATQTASTENPMFGMWRDREEMADVASHVQKLRAPRYRPDGSRNDENLQTAMCSGSQSAQILDEATRTLEL